MAERRYTLPVYAIVYDDGTVGYEVIIEGEGEGEDEDGRPMPPPPSCYVAVDSLPPGLARAVTNRITDAYGVDPVARPPKGAGVIVGVGQLTYNGDQPGAAE